MIAKLIDNRLTLTRTELFILEYFTTAEPTTTEPLTTTEPITTAEPTTTPPITLDLSAFEALNDTLPKGQLIITINLFRIRKIKCKIIF